VGGLGFHALQLPVAAAQFGDEAFDSFLVHFMIPMNVASLSRFGKGGSLIPTLAIPPVLQ
jgi:hypothetical protein